ncbi:MAG: Hpt domain-containing protein [Proteobacteria bacterium]|nr:Hpt domain-containing protein [Pseudomonadota bacterium]NOG60986.1 Hpt domain-containing protein [Pseudomonadota bacterium]
MESKKNKSNSALIDESILKELKSIMDDEFTDVLQNFLEESVSLMSEIHLAFEEESDNLLDVILSFKSCGNNVGAICLGNIAEDIQQCLVKNDLDSARNRLGELQDIFTQSHVLIKKYLQDNMDKVA